MLGTINNKRIRDFIFLFLLILLLIVPAPAFSQDSGGDSGGGGATPPPIQCQEGQTPNSSGECQDLPKLCGEAVQLLPLNFDDFNLTFDEIKEKYKDKFPFSFLYFEKSTDNQQTCPIFELSGRSIPFCLPLEILRLAKYPALIGWIIWLISNL